MDSADSFRGISVFAWGSGGIGGNVLSNGGKLVRIGGKPKRIGDNPPRIGDKLAQIGDNANRGICHPSRCI